VADIPSLAVIKLYNQLPIMKTMNWITQLSPQKLHLESYPLKLMHVYVMYMIYMLSMKSTPTTCRGRHSRDRMEVLFTNH